MSVTEVLTGVPTLVSTITTSFGTLVSAENGVMGFIALVPIMGVTGYVIRTIKSIMSLGRGRRR